MRSHRKASRAANSKVLAEANAQESHRDTKLPHRIKISNSTSTQMHHGGSAQIDKVRAGPSTRSLHFTLLRSDGDPLLTTTSEAGKREAKGSEGGHIPCQSFHLCDEASNAQPGKFHKPRRNACLEAFSCQQNGSKRRKLWCTGKHSGSKERQGALSTKYTRTGRHKTISSYSAHHTFTSGPCQCD